MPDLADEVRLLEAARARLSRSIRGLLDREQHRLDALRSRPVLARPATMLDQRAEQVGALRARGPPVPSPTGWSGPAPTCSHTLARLRALSPAATLERGYAIVQRGPTVLRDAAQATPGDELRIRLAAGELTAVVSPLAVSPPDEETS